MYIFIWKKKILKSKEINLAEAIIVELALYFTVFSTSFIWHIFYTLSSISIRPGVEWFMWGFPSSAKT